MTSVSFNRRKFGLLASTALTKPVVALGALVLGANSAFALDPHALPQDPTVVGGGATFHTSGPATLTVNQSTHRTVIDWRSFDIGSKATTNFVQPNASSIAVNRINGSANPTQIQGSLNANGQVWVLNPNGVYFGKTARIDVAGLVASTGNIDVQNFMRGDTNLQLTGAQGGSVVNEGAISVADGGLAAFVAPSVRNSGTITARVGKVALAAGTTFTLDLAGDRLVEIGLGADNAIVDHTGSIVAEGSTIEISAKAASALVDSVVNVAGTVLASSAYSDGGAIVLAADSITTTASAELKADGGDAGNGGSIIAIAEGTGVYDGTFSAKGGENGGDGGFIETSGKTVQIAEGISVNTLAANGNAGNWTIDPDDLEVVDGAAGGLDPDASTITNGTIVNQLATTGITLAANNSITVNAAIDSSGQTSSTTLALNDQDADGDLTINLNERITLGANQSLTGQGTTVNVAGDARIQNGVDVASADGATVNVTAGTYEENVTINKSDLSLLSVAGRDATTIVGQGNTALGTVRVTAGTNNVTIGDEGQGFTIIGIDNGAPGIESAAVYFQGNNSGSTVAGNRITANGDNGLLTEYGATVSDLTIDGNIFDGQTFSGATSGGVGFGDQFTVPNVPRQLVVVGGGNGGGNTSNVTFTNNEVIGTAGGVNADGIEQGNTLVTIDSVGATITGNTFAGATTRFGSALRARGTGTVVSGNTFDGTNMGVGTDMLTLRDGAFAGSFADVVSNNTWVKGSVWTSNVSRVFRGIQNAIANAADGSTVNVGSGTYNEALSITKNLDIVGAGADETIIRPDALLATGVGHKYDANMKVAVFVNGADEVNLSGMTIDGNNLGANAVVFWNNASGSITDAVIKNPMAFSGAQTGQGLAVDATGATTSDLTLSNVTFEAWNKNAIDAVTGGGSTSGGGNINLTVNDSSFTGRGANGTNAQNGILLWERGGASSTVSATVDNTTFADIAYTGINASSSGILVYGSPNGTLEISNSTFTNVEKYIGLAAGSSKEVDATEGNTFDGVAVESATLDQLFDIEDRLLHKLDDTANGLVRIVENSVFVTAAKSLLAGVNAALDGDTVNVADGTHDIGGTPIEIRKSINFVGQSEDGTIIDGRGVGAGLGTMMVAADNVSLSNFTLYGADSGSNNYGIKVQPNPTGYNRDQRLYDFSISDVTVRGSTRAELDLNGVVGATIANFTADGRRVNDPSHQSGGAGIQITDSQNVTLEGVHTLGNAWGSVAIYQTNAVGAYNSLTDNINIDANENTFEEDIGVFVQSYSTEHPEIGQLNLTGFDYVVRNTGHRANGDEFTFFRTDFEDATEFAFNIGAANTSSIEGWNGTGYTNEFTVVEGLKIQSAIRDVRDGGIINVAPGEYSEGVTNVGYFGEAGGQKLGLYVYKDNLTIRGVDGDGVAITDPSQVGAWITSLYQTGFGAQHFISGSGVTIDGLGFKPFSGGNNKTVEVIGDDFTLRNSVIDNSGNVTSANFYISDFEQAGRPPVESFTLENNIFYGGTTAGAMVVVGGGVGRSTDASERVIDGNQFIGNGLVGQRGFQIQGRIPSLAWQQLTAGPVTVTNNVFTDVDIPVRTTGILTGRLAWEDIFKNNGNVFSNGAALAFEGSSTDARGTVVDDNGELREDIRITSGIQTSIDIAQAGDTVRVLAGTYNEEVTINKGLALEGVDADDRTAITNGIKLAGTFSNLALKNLYVTNDTPAATRVIGGSTAVTNLTLDNVVIDGQNIASQHGFSGGHYGGDISITNSQFLNIGNWSVFDTRSGAGGPAAGTLVTNVVFSNNLIDNVKGGITFRQQEGGTYSDVTISDNIVQNIGSTANSTGGIFKIFNADTVEFSGNTVSDIGTNGSQSSDGINYGAALLARGVSELNVSDNSFTNVHMAVAVEKANSAPGQTTFTGNTFDNTGYAFFMPGDAVDGGNVTFGAGNEINSGADTVQHIVWRNSSALDLTGVEFNGKLGSEMTDAELFALEDLITHGTDLALSGLAEVTAGNVYVTTNSGSIQRGIDKAGAGDTINIASGTYAEDVSVTGDRDVLFNNATIDSFTASVAAGIGGTATAAGGFILDVATLLSDTVLNGTLTAGSIDGSTEGGETLTVNAGGGAVELGNVGATTRLGSTSVTGATTFTGDTYAANALTFNGDAVLTQALTSFDTSDAAGDIRFNGDIFGSVDGAQSVSFNAGPGTGSPDANGDIILKNAGTNSIWLGSMDVTGDNFSAETVYVGGTFNSQLTGNQAFSNGALHSKGTVDSNVGGDATGPINSASNVNLTAGGDVTGDFTAPSGTLTGDTVTGTFAGNTFNIVAATTVDLQVDVTTLNVTAPLGTIDGTFVNLNTSGSGSLIVNGKTRAGDSESNPNQLVVEGFELPVGAVITETGDIILPEGIVIGLISPQAGPGVGGTTPKIVIVNNVHELGELLAQGYVAIVVDLKKDDDKEEIVALAN